MSAGKGLTASLQKQVLLLEDDLRGRVESDPETRDRWVGEHQQAVTRGRTASSWQAWRDDRVTQAAVAWVLTTVFVRFCEDNGLVRQVWIAGPEDRRQEALDAELTFYRSQSREQDDITARDWLLEGVGHLASLSATAALVDEHSALHLVQPSGDAATALLAFWRERGDDGALVHDFADRELDTRFLGDLYQDLSEHAKATFALLQTPEFVEEFILDRTLTPALEERPLEGFRLIDPTCGSGHFLLGAFDRLLDRWERHAPGMERQAQVQEALDAIHGVDLNPFAVAIARFRLTVLALKTCGLRSLEAAPAFRFHLAVGDSLLHGPGQQTLQSDTDLSAFTYSTEDLNLLQQILAPGRYDVVVGNPPYIMVKDRMLNDAYRSRYRHCKGKYSLVVPFMERFFELAKRQSNAQRSGWVGQLTANSFMKREFGRELIEKFLVNKDLRLVVDASGAYVPGHGTPTVILVARNEAPAGRTTRAILGVRGEPGKPADPAKGLVWQSIVQRVDEPGHNDDWITVADLDTSILASHPWTLSGGGAVDLLARINSYAGRSLSDVADSIGITAFTLEDEAFVAAASSFRTRGVPEELCRDFVSGDSVRDFALQNVSKAIFPYGGDFQPLIIENFPGPFRWMWPFRANLGASLLFGGKTKAQVGLRWSEYGRLTVSKLRTPLAVSFAFVSTHNHFALDRGGRVFNRTAPVIKLTRGATEEDHLRLLGPLNSSLGCFWLKQNSHSKGNEGYGSGIKSENWERFWEFTATTLQSFPLPLEQPVPIAGWMDSAAHDLARSTPAALMAAKLPSADGLADAHARHGLIRARMIANQEELDWEVYRLYGLVDEDLTYPGEDLPGLALGERAFEVALARKVAAGEEETAWFARHGSTPITELPSRWPAAYRELVERRLELIASDPSIRLLERPEYKRRWASESWEKRQTAALRDWLLERLEDRRFWFDRQGRPAPRSVAQLADEVARDADMVSVLALWEGRPDVPVLQSLTKLLADEAVPFLAAYRYKDSGLRKREAWEQTWALQRREDAGEAGGPIPVPPKYTSADFRKTSYWQVRGKLDVPKERFISYPDAGRETDPTPLLGWAGWDHAQQSLALSVIIGAREAEGWADERLVPLVAGLAELQPWVQQWHAEIDPAYGVSLAAFCREQLTTRAAQVGQTLDQLAAWRPAPATRGRKPKTTA